jgi:hypothetical protein
VETIKGLCKNGIVEGIEAGQLKEEAIKRYFDCW